MTTTVYAAGTVITHEWLNDVDKLTYQVTSQTAAAGQTSFAVPAYVQGGRLMVWINGLLQEYNVDYTENSTGSILFSEGLQAGDVVTTRG